MTEKKTKAAANIGVFSYAGCRINPRRHIANQLQPQLHEHNRAGAMKS